jgi:adenylate cyclase class IV
MTPARLNREMKSFCDDFRPIRRILRDIGATLAGQKDQVDYFFFLPDLPGKAGSRRLKLRIDDGKPRLIYYYDRNQPGSRSVEFQVSEVNDPQIKDLLEIALGVRTIVRKRREVWQKGNATFNLDRVHGVGNVFEVEVQVSDAGDELEQIAHYRHRFGPYLGADIVGSNEDMVAAVRDEAAER